MPMRPLVGRGYAPDTRAVSEAVAPMGSACDLQIQSRTRSRRGRSPDLRKGAVSAVEGFDVVVQGGEGAVVDDHVIRDRQPLPPGGLGGDHAVGEGGVDAVALQHAGVLHRSEEHTSELQSLMRISYAVCCLKKKK